MVGFKDLLCRPDSPLSLQPARGFTFPPVGVGGGMSYSGKGLEKPGAEAACAINRPEWRGSGEA